MEDEEGEDEDEEGLEDIDEEGEDGEEDDGEVIYNKIDFLYHFCMKSLMDK